MLNSSQIITESGSRIEIKVAQIGDLTKILSLFDETVAWLVAHGMERQWGTTPFSEIPQMRERFLKWIGQSEMLVARHNEQLVGTLVVSETAPTYVAQFWERFPVDVYYLEAFTTARTLVGQGIGRALLQWVEQYAVRAGKTALWLDCWAENDALRRYYEQAGFSPRQEFLVGEWSGQLFERQLAKID